ncbi:MAG TPA: cupredoxin domain-containing protein [Myxococcaceae bacterium]|nr:cupredoxin domain-containing protein [Myxococcaceae bacterium]
MRAVVLGAALVLLLGAGAQEPAPPRVVTMTARKFEYSPAEIHVKRGEHVVLELTSLDRKHGFKLPELGIRSDVPPGGTARVELTPANAGRFPFACDVFCGDGHEDMTGTLVVDP